MYPHTPKVTFIPQGLQGFKGCRDSKGYRDSSFRGCRDSKGYRDCKIFIKYAPFKGKVRYMKRFPDNTKVTSVRWQWWECHCKTTVKEFLPVPWLTKNCPCCKKFMQCTIKPIVWHPRGLLYVLDEQPC